MENFKKPDTIRLFLILKSKKICLKTIYNLVEIMPTNRILKFNKLQKEEDKINCLLGYLTLFYALKKLKISQKPPILIYKNQKPKLVFPNISFNLSHTKNIIALAISKDSVGVDAETIRPFNPNLPKKILCDNEHKKFIKTSNKEKFLFSAWTRKEAFCKRKSISIFDNILKIDSTSLKNTKTFFLSNSAISISYTKNFKLKIFLIDKYFNIIYNIFPCENFKLS